MKKLILISMVVLIAVLAACVSSGGKPGVNYVEIPHPTNRSHPGWQVPPNRTIFFIFMDEWIHNKQKGTITIGFFRVKDYRTGKYSFEPLELSSLVYAPRPAYTRGARSETDTAEDAAIEEIIAALSEEIKNNPKNKDAYLQRASLLYTRGKNNDFSLVIQDCNEVLKIDRSETAAYYLRGIASARVGDFKQAKSDMAVISKLGDNSNIGMLYEIGMAYMVEGEINQAIEMLEQVVKTTPDFLDAAMVLEDLRKL